MRIAPISLALLEGELAAPSLYDEALRLSARNGVTVPARLRSSATFRSRTKCQEGWSQHGGSSTRPRKPTGLLYELAEKLVDFEDYFRRWRFNHVTTVERVIGFKRGTGGTSGVSYLKRMLEVELFPELWRVRTVL